MHLSSAFIGFRCPVEPPSRDGPTVQPRASSAGASSLSAHDSEDTGRQGSDDKLVQGFLGTRAGHAHWIC